MCQGDEQIHKDLANLMGHKKTTADRHYYLEEKIESSDRAAEALPLVMCCSVPGEPFTLRRKATKNQVPLKKRKQKGNRPHFQSVKLRKYKILSA